MLSEKSSYAFGKKVVCFFDKNPVHLKADSFFLMIVRPIKQINALTIDRLSGKIRIFAHAKLFCVGTQR